MQTLTLFQKETIQHQYDSFIRKVLRERCRDYFRHLSYLLNHEACFSELSEAELAKLSITEEYPSDVFPFSVQEYTVTVRDESLAMALAALSATQRDIILLSYFLDMTDREIADRLNAARSTIQYQRAKTLKKLKAKLEEIRYDKTTSEKE